MGLPFDLEASPQLAAPSYQLVLRLSHRGNHRVGRRRVFASGRSRPVMTMQREPQRRPDFIISGHASRSIDHEGPRRWHLIVTSVRHRASATGFQAVAVVAAMTITTAITIKMGSVPRLTCKSARHVGALPPAHNFPLRILFPRLTNADKWEPMPLRPNLVPRYHLRWIR